MAGFRLPRLHALAALPIKAISREPIRVCVASAQALGGDSGRFLRSHNSDWLAAPSQLPLISIRTDKGCFLFTRAGKPSSLAFATFLGVSPIGSGSAAPILRGAKSAAAKEVLSPISPVDECERRFGFPLRPCATAKKRKQIMKSASTYRAVQAVSKGKLELTEKPLVDPPAGHVRIRVEACGVCHSDSATVEGILPIAWPRVPGHEAVGRIEVIGSGVEGWKVGQRVGVGFLGGSCGYCEYCRDGDVVNCINQGYTGVQQDGGYAEVMMAKASGLIAVPDDLSSVDAAPLLCAGLTTFSALRNSPARVGDMVAVFEVGGLGHSA